MDRATASHGERIAVLESQMEGVMKTMTEQGKHVVALQKLTTAMRVAWAGERVKVALLVSAIGTVFTSIVAGIVTFVVAKLNGLVP